jgi:hypothetical protein
MPPRMAAMCSIPDDYIDPRRSGLFMARSILRESSSRTDGGDDAQPIVADGCADGATGGARVRRGGVSRRWWLRSRRAALLR